MHTHRVDERARGALAHRDRGDVEGRRLVGLAHIPGPLRVEVVAALDVGLLGLGRLVALVARMQVALERILGIGAGVGVDRGRLDEAHRRALDRAGRTQLVAATRQHHVVEAATREERGRGGQPEVHGERDGLLFVVAGHDLPHVAAR